MTSDAVRQRLSVPVDSIRSDYDVVVVGSGYGGGVAAARLAEAGRQVCVVERGSEWHPGDFPSTELEAAAQVQVDIGGRRIGRPLGLYDLRINPDISVLVGCGLGGTSLINANVGLVPEPGVLEDAAWPAALRADRHGVAQGLARAREMLAPTPYPDDAPPLPKLEALATVATAIGGRLERPDLYVTFVEGVNTAGQHQAACTSCGDCVTGCNVGAKNTVATNYLPRAHRLGAHLLCEADVRWVEPGAVRRWRVGYRFMDPGRRGWVDEALAIEADVVIVAGGSLGSTELLLRSAERGLAVSSHLGAHFSGNGDVLGIAYNTDVACRSVGYGAHDVGGINGGRTPRPPVGPCIAGVVRRDADDRDDRFIIEEGTIPGPVAGLMPELIGAAARLEGQSQGAGGRHFGREIESLLLGARRGAIAHTLVYLGMSHDDGNGTMRLADGRVRIDWPGVGSQRNASSLDAAMRQGTEALGGVWVRDPISTEALGRRLITVHPLGGCVMAEDSATGVVDHEGRVFDPRRPGGVHDGLYVMDGATVPIALGVNPSLTITALAERNVALLRLRHGWSPDVVPTPDQQEAGMAPSTPPIGVQFTEVMHGTVAPVRHEGGSGTPEGTAIRFELTIRCDDVDALITRPDHVLHAAGWVHLPAWSSEPMQVSDGSLQCLVVDPHRANVRNLRYRLRLLATDGDVYEFDGVKVLRTGPVTRLWRETTTLAVVLRRAGDPEGAWEGTMRLGPADFLTQLSTIRAVDAPSALAGLEARAAFGRWFAGTLWDTYGGVFAGTTDIDPTAAPRLRRALRAPAPEVHPVVATDGVEIRLTRYRAGRKGPVLLAHGLGVSSGIFTLDTIESNLVEHLAAHGYDIWLLDTRQSTALQSVALESTGDDVALRDWPAAMDEVRRVTSAATVQVVAHCFGAVTFMMALLAGVGGVRSAVCSQIGGHLVTPPLKALESGLHLPGALEALGVRAMTASADEHRGWRSQLYDEVLKGVDAGHGQTCRSKACHRVTFMYGPLFDHEQIAALTHDTLGEVFGIAGIAALGHLATMVRAGHLTDASGADIYLPGVAHAAIPISFIHGEDNHCWLPESTARTVAWLSQHNGPELYDRRVIAGYGHIDCVIGWRAAQDVYPHIVAALDRSAGDAG